MQIPELFPSMLERVLAEYSEGTISDFIPDSYTSLPELQEHMLYPCVGGTRHLHNPDSFAFQDLECYLFLYTSGGQGVIQSEGDSRMLDTGSLLFWDCRDYLLLRPVTADWTVRLLFFSGNLAHIYYEEICKLCFPVFSFSEKSTAFDNLRRLTEFGQITSPHHAIEANRLLTDFLSDLLINLHAGQLDKKAPPSYLQKIRSLFDTQYQQAYSIADLADSFQISRYRLSREFSEHYGLSPVKYLNSVRLSHACSLLETTSLHVHEISSAVGFDSVTHFIHLFKAKNGMTPTAYRDGYRAFREIDHE
ncbi:MAG: AraC family transcriptional regulator [Lachnospiraceae bacterium]|nr:AraC family transcriptional regulator [Lachnospiraceae bacterium]